jgi:Na+/H+-dicarboxylate symporter
MTKNNRLTIWILIAMVLGIAVGYAMHHGMELQARKEVADNLKILTDIFLRLVKMIIAPLVFSTLVVGIAKLGDMKTVGRVGGRALLWFMSASLVSLLLGMLLVNVLKPGVGLQLEASGDVADVIGKTQAFTLKDFIAHLFPKSIVEAMATNEVLQIVVFSLFFGVACASIGDYAKPVVKLLESVSHVILKMVGYVMNFAPLGVFGAIAAVIAIHGLGVLSTYAVYIGQFYLGLLILWIILLACRLPFPGPSDEGTDATHRAAGHHRLQHHQQRSSDAEAHGGAGTLRLQGQGGELRAAIGLQLQPGRQHDVHDLRQPLHRAGLRHHARS